MIKISNLHYELTEDDIYDLLNKVGEVRSVRLDYDISGRSIGTAIANFNSPHEAEEAVRRFNGRKAAGVIISVELHYYHSDRKTGRFDSRGPRNSGRGRDPHHRRGNDDRNRSDAKPYQRSERAPRKPKKTLEELDAELTSYMNGGSGDLPEPNNSSHDNNDPVSSSSSSNNNNNNNNNNSIEPNNSSNFGDKSSINNSSNSTAAKSNNDQHPPAQKDDDEMVLD